jgi:hypothetical protein
MQFRKVYAILLASLLHRDPNDSIVTLWVSASLNTHTTREVAKTEICIEKVITSNMMLKHLQTVYVIKSEEIIRKPQQSYVDNPNNIDNQYWLVTPQFRFRKALHPKNIDRTPFRFSCLFCFDVRQRSMFIVQSTDFGR